MNIKNYWKRVYKSREEEKGGVKKKIQKIEVLNHSLNLQIKKVSRSYCNLYPVLSITNLIYDTWNPSS